MSGAERRKSVVISEMENIHHIKKTIKKNLNLSWFNIKGKSLRVSGAERGNNKKVLTAR